MKIWFPSWWLFKLHKNISCFWASKRSKKSQEMYWMPGRGGSLEWSSLQLARPHHRSARQGRRGRGGRRDLETTAGGATRGVHICTRLLGHVGGGFGERSLAGCQKRIWLGLYNDLYVNRSILDVSNCCCRSIVIQCHPEKLVNFLIGHVLLYFLFSQDHEWSILDLFCSCSIYLQA